MRKTLGMVGMVLFLGVALLMPAPASAVNVNLELALLVDVSGSVDANEFNLQKSGYVQAFQNLFNANPLGTPKPLAATLIYWSGASQQQQAVGWTLINDAATSNAFATAINSAARPYSGLTAPGSAINFAVPLFNNNGFESNIQIIDVSGDGSQNDGANTATARNNALVAGIDRINGLAILGSEANLLTWYQNNIQGGTGSFTIAAADFNDFARAVEAKINREAFATPIPGSLLLLGTGVLGLIGLRRKLLG